MHSLCQRVWVDRCLSICSPWGGKKKSSRGRLQPSHATWNENSALACAELGKCSAYDQGNLLPPRFGGHITGFENLMNPCPYIASSVPSTQRMQLLGYMLFPPIQFPSGKEVITVFISVPLCLSMAILLKRGINRNQWKTSGEMFLPWLHHCFNWLLSVCTTVASTRHYVAFLRD